jgi:hypothetical protein
LRINHHFQKTVKKLTVKWLLRSNLIKMLHRRIMDHVLLHIKSAAH